MVIATMEPGLSKAMEMLVRGTHSSHTWTYRVTKDPDDFRRPPDLRGVLQEVGAKVRGIWYSFGEYGFVALIETPDATNSAAFGIALRAGWDGKAFDRVVLAPLLNQSDAAAACGIAAKGLAKSRDASKNGPSPARC